MGDDYVVSKRRMEKACVYIGIHSWILNGACYESLCAVGAIPHAGVANVDALCRIWNTDSKDECEGEKVDSHRIGG